MREDDCKTPLGKAIAILSGGRKLPLTIAAELLQEGFDVGAIERRHFKPMKTQYAS